MVQTDRVGEHRVGSGRVGAGWLRQLNQERPDAQWEGSVVAGVFVPSWSEREQAPFPTRVAEYSFAAEVLDCLDGGYLVDAGAGFNPEIHLMPQIAASLGYDVIAIDAEEASLVMPALPNVVRYKGDISATPVLDATADVWLCISTLEHVPAIMRFPVVQEARRILKPGGYAIVTVDEMEPEKLNDLFRAQRFEVGAVVPFEGTHLSPRVAWCVARKPSP